jgi:hypothetical protein
MKKCLTLLMNKVLIEELENLYGKGSNIEISSIVVASRHNETIISYKLFYTNQEYLLETMNVGSDFLMEKCWELMGYPKTKLILACSMQMVDL